MFSVYGASGRLFRGNLEQLRQVAPVHATDRLRAMEPVWRDAPVALLPPAALSPGPPQPELGRRNEARAAYAPPRPPTGQRWRNLPVGEAMVREVLVFADTDSVARAWRQLDARHHAQAPVVNAAHVLVGMVTLPRLAKLFAQARFEPHAVSALAAQPLSSCMWSPVASVSVHADLRRAAAVLLESGLPALPVVDDDGHVVGLLSRGDVLRVVLEDTAIDEWG